MLPETQILVPDVHECYGTSVGLNLMDGMQQVLLPHMDISDAGIPCKARSKLNQNCKNNVNCVREKRECTGEGFDAVRKAAKMHCPIMAEQERVTDWRWASGATCCKDVLSTSCVFFFHYVRCVALCQLTVVHGRSPRACIACI